MEIDTEDAELLLKNHCVFSKVSTSSSLFSYLRRIQVASGHKKGQTPEDPLK